MLIFIFLEVTVITAHFIQPSPNSTLYKQTVFWECVFSQATKFCYTLSAMCLYIWSYSSDCSILINQLHAKVLSPSVSKGLASMIYKIISDRSQGSLNVEEGGRRVSVGVMWREKDSTDHCWLWRWKRNMGQGIRATSKSCEEKENGFSHKASRMNYSDVKMTILESTRTHALVFCRQNFYIELC